MTSNLHPDMSGNPCDEPFYCAHCEREVKEEEAYGIAGNDELLFCSAICAEEYDDAAREAWAEMGHWIDPL